MRDWSINYNDQFFVSIQSDYVEGIFEQKQQNPPKKRYPILNELQQSAENNQFVLKLYDTNGNLHIFHKSSGFVENVIIFPHSTIYLYFHWLIIMTFLSYYREKIHSRPIQMKICVQKLNSIQNPLVIKENKSRIILDYALISF